MTIDSGNSTCGCATAPAPDETAPAASPGVTRRGLLRAAMAVGAAAGLSGPLVSSRVAFAAEGRAYAGDVLVVLSLRGGFDGLSAVVPVAEAAYYAARPNVAVPAAQTLPIDQQFGLHPALGGLKSLYDAGALAVVPAVGQPASSRSHFHAMAELERAAPGTSLRTGWLDRMVGASGAPSTFAGAVVGDAHGVMSFAGPTQEMVVPSIDKFSLTGASSAGDIRRWATALRRLHAGARPELSGPATAATAAVGTLARIGASSYSPANGAAYPKSPLGDALRDVARLVKARVGLRAVAVDEGDWDMHSAMGSSTDGWMRRKLVDLDAALTAFMSDLGAGAGVTLVTLSEFGRRVAENGSGGVDHGAGNAMFVLGGGVAGGVYGAWPGLDKAALDDGDLRGTTDFRVVLAEVLERRCGLNARAVFPGVGNTRLGLTRQR